MKDTADIRRKVKEGIRKDVLYTPSEIKQMKNGFFDSRRNISMVFIVVVVASVFGMIASFILAGGISTSIFAAMKSQDVVINKYEYMFIGLAFLSLISLAGSLALNAWDKKLDLTVISDDYDIMLWSKDFKSFLIKYFNTGDRMKIDGILISPFELKCLKEEYGMRTFHELESNAN